MQTGLTDLGGFAHRHLAAAHRPWRLSKHSAQHVGSVPETLTNPPTHPGIAVVAPITPSWLGSHGLIFHPRAVFGSASTRLQLRLQTPPSRFWFAKGKKKGADSTPACLQSSNSMVGIVGVWPKRQTKSTLPESSGVGNERAGVPERARAARAARHIK